MVEIMTREASSCDLKELVGKFIPEAIGTMHATPLLPQPTTQCWTASVHHCYEWQEDYPALL